MKQAIIFVGLILLAFTPEKKYSVNLSVNQWQQDINIIEYTKGVLKGSDAPAKIILPLIDSLTKIQNEFVTQLKVQIADSTKKK